MVKNAVKEQKRKRVKQDKDGDAKQDTHVEDVAEDVKSLKKKKRKKTDEPTKQRQNFLKIDFRVPTDEQKKDVEEQPVDDGTYKATDDLFKLSDMIDTYEPEEDEQEVLLMDDGQTTSSTGEILPQKYENDKLEKYYAHFEKLKNVMSLSFPLNTHYFRNAVKPHCFSENITETEINSYINSSMCVRGNSFFTSQDEIRTLAPGSRKLYDYQTYLKSVRHAGNSIKKIQAKRRSTKKTKNKLFKMMKMIFYLFNNVCR
ncbi:translation initiation factor 4E [Acrasis kona]|uniref:Translation initiation factor 4E n=1 Tax=Acrasis kona TaxID=1008807 RepID=A0AAW2ZKG3_9EUKA